MYSLHSGIVRVQLKLKFLFYIKNIKILGKNKILEKNKYEKIIYPLNGHWDI